MNGSKKRTTADVEDPEDPERDPLGSRRLDLHRDLTDLASQVQMMSDSLAACKQMSKARPLRKMYCMKANGRADVTVPETPVQVLLSPEERVQDNRDDEEEQVIVSYMVGESYKMGKRESERSEGRQQRNWGRKLGGVASAAAAAEEELADKEKATSKIRMYSHGEVENSRMIDVIRRELKVLMEMAPAVSSLATALSETISHYKECDRCSEKISPSLPWILNRIQKLIKYVTKQRLGTYRWPDDSQYLRPRPTDLTAPPLPPPPTPPRRLLADARQLDPTSAAEDVPGLQLLLEISPDHSHKKLFQTADNRRVAPADSFLNFPVVHLTQPQSQPLVQVLLPHDDPVILLQEKRQAVVLREFAYAPLLVFAFRLGSSASLLLASPVGSLTRTSRASLPLPAGGRGQERCLPPRKRFPEGHLNPRQGKEKTLRHSETLPKRSNAKESSSPRDLLARVPEIVKDFLREAEEENMHDQSVRNLEAGAKGLRDLMTEVHKNQLELSKVLLQKGVYPQPIIKLTDPDMLEKETEVMRRVAEYQGPGPKGVSIEALQTALDDLKHKCALKNRVILIILKGLRSNIPKEWWEDMVEYVFEEKKPGEDAGPEAGSGGSVGRTPWPPRNAEQGPKQEGRPQRAEDQPREEEASVRGSVGAEVEESQEKVWKNDGAVEKRKAVTSEGVPVGESPGGVGSSIRKLEKQVSLLNAENERLRHEVEDLKNLLRSSVDQLRDRRVSRLEWDHRPSTRSPGKTINLTIEIVDKEHRRDAARPRSFAADGAAGRARSLALKYRDADSSSGPVDSDTDEGDPEQELGHVSPLRTGPGSRRNSLEDPGTGPRDRAPTPAQEAFRKPKPAERVAPEASDGCVAGPSRRPADASRLLQKPSVMELAESECPGTTAATANARELQTIPENELGPSGSSKGLSGAIERLRSRVRSIHKDVTVLKSKNDRIDKLLDRLVEDAMENGEGFEEMESKLNLLREQLG